jgi:Tfp pilus assembly protein PilO
MNNRIWILGTALVCVAILALGGLVFIKPKVDEIFTSTAGVVTTTLTNQQYELDLQALKAQYENLGEVEDKLAALRLSLPSGPDHAELLRLIDAAATAAGVAVNDYLTSSPIIYGATDAAGGTTSAANPGSISGGTLAAIPISLQISTGAPQSVFQFMDNLRLSTRLLLIYDWSMAPDSTDGPASLYTFDIKIYAYTLIDPNAPAPSPTPTDGAGQPTPSETPTPSPTSTAPVGETPTPTDSVAPVTP